MKIQYLHILPVTLLALFAGACSDSPTDLPEADPSTYITFATPSLNFDATLGNFTNDGRTSSRATATEVGDFKVWGFCLGRNALNNDDEPATATQEWNEKSKYFRNSNLVADLANLNGQVVTAATGKYNNGTLTAWNTTPNAMHSFIGAVGNASFTMQPAGSNTFTPAGSTTSNKTTGPNLKIVLPLSGGTVDNTQLDIDAQPDIMVAGNFNVKKGSRVAMEFMHFMTGIRFKIHNHSNKELIIHSLTYGGTFFNTAYLDFTTQQPVMSVDESQTYSGTFKLISTEQSVKAGTSDFMDGNENRVLLLLPNPAGTTDNDGRFVLGKDKVIKVSYNLDGDNDGPREYEYKNFTLGYLPQSNTLNTANLHFVGDEFVLVFQDDTSKNWQNGTNGNKVDITIK